MPRFTLSLHAGGKEEDHFDLFLEQGDVLKTWRLKSANFSPAQAAVPIKDHKKTYLDFEGEVTGKRGHVKIWDTGTYSTDLWTDDRIQIALQGRQTRGRIILQKDKEKAADAWIVADAAAGLRKAAAAFLRGEALDPAPTPELDALREALSAEERRLMAQIDLFARGGHVNWSQVELNPELAPRLDAERVRWQHPWLMTAKKYVGRLAEMSGLLAQVRPPG